MKTRHQALAPVAILAVCAIASPLGYSANPGAATIPTEPFGWLSANPTWVAAGEYTKLSWNILYPSTLGDVAKVNPPGTLILNQPMYVTVQPVGTDVTAGDPTQGANKVYAEARVSCNGGGYQQLFYGTQDDVDPSAKLFVKKLQAGNTIDFGGRYVPSGSSGWTSFYTTRNANLQVMALMDGDTPQTSFSLYQSPTLKNYLKPYLDGTGKVKIGPMSVLIVMELGATNHTQTCFDYQDMVLLVTLSAKHPNNGHGNNLDGVDSSNPGQGSGGPNGEIDPSGDFDDEMR